MNIKLLSILSCCLLLWSSCKKELIDPDEKLLIEAFLDNKGIVAQQDSNAGYYIYYYQQLSEKDDAPLIKATLDKSMEAVVNYKAYLLDGTVIHPISTSPETITIDNAISGLQLVLTRMAIGEKILLVLPSRLAYGETSTDKIPANSILVFEIELVNVNPHF